MKKLILYFWQLPQNILGLLVVLLTRAKKQGSIYIAEKFFRSGVSLGQYIILEKNTFNDLDIKHEQGHSKQSLYLGLIYLIVVGIPSIIINIISRIFNKDDRWYYSKFPEKWADRLGEVKRVT